MNSEYSNLSGIASNAIAPYMLRENYFLAAIFLAFLVHLGGFVVWNFSPRQEVRDIPIRMLNIRLSDSEDITAESANMPQVEAVVERIADSVSKQQSVAEQNNDTASAKQYVREVSSTSVRKNPAGSTSGSKARDAEMVSRYTQLISLWIQKFKQYPEEARANGIQGMTVVRIRIDRRGNIRYQALERSTGSKILDRAAVEMIRRANPVPAVPDDYPPGEISEFLIPVNFSLF